MLDESSVHKRCGPATELRYVKDKSHPGLQLCISCYHRLPRQGKSDQKQDKSLVQKYRALLLKTMQLLPSHDLSVIEGELAKLDTKLSST
jgi:hypothetical protein